MNPTPKVSQFCLLLLESQMCRFEDMDSLFFGAELVLLDHVALVYYKSFSCGALHRLS